MRVRWALDFVIDVLDACRVEHEDRVAAIEREGDALAEALRLGDPRERVPSCPNWTVTDLAAHVGEFVALWTHVLCEAGHRPKTPYRPLVEANESAVWFEALLGHLLDELRVTTADAPCWTWVPHQQNVAFVARRAANELAVHRYDAEAASGTAKALTAASAADIIDEVFVMLPVWDNPPDGSGLSLHAHATDGGEWTIEMLSEGPVASHDHRPADLSITATTSDLALLLFQRPTIGPVHMDGNPEALAAWYREFHFG